MGCRIPTWCSFVGIQGEIEWTQARTDWLSVGEVEEQHQRKHGGRIDGCCSITRKAQAILEQAKDWTKLSKV